MAAAGWYGAMNPTTALDGPSSDQAMRRSGIVGQDSLNHQIDRRRHGACGYQSDPKSVARLAPNHQQHLARRFQAVRSLVAAQRTLHFGPGGIFRSL